MQRLDSVDKINGKAVFGIDFFLPGMLYSTLERPPAYGAKLLSFDKDGPLKVQGVKQVVPVKDGVAVLATDIESAWKGRTALNAKWNGGAQPALDDASLEKAFADSMRSKGIFARNEGDVDKALDSAAKKIHAEYSIPFIAHASIEPHNCTAHVQADRCDVWVPTQGQALALKVAMDESGFPADKVYIHALLPGGGFGGKVEVFEVAEAVRISKASGHAVKHVWTRSEDFQNDCFRPGSLHRIEAGLDAHGNLNSWKHKVVVPPIMERLMPERVKDGLDPSAVDGIANMSYSIPNIQNEYVRFQTPILTGFWRSVGNTSNTFVVESFIDEMALLAGKDPLEFRLQLLKDDPRSARVLQKAAEAAEWGKPLPEGVGRGIAQRFCFGSYCAQVAEVSVDKKTGAIKVHRIVAALDPGQVVNPDSVIAQIEGGVIIALSVALKERISFAKGGVATSNFSGYPILTMSETPRIEAHLITMGEKIGGIGEPPVPPVAPAVANAVCSATGVRVRKLPMTPETVLAAMKNKG
jgi:isoquinoline 1-oxidoreductase beta subunit